MAYTLTYCSVVLSVAQCLVSYHSSIPAPSSLKFQQTSTTEIMTPSNPIEFHSPVVEVFRSPADVAVKFLV